jgi:hypothetical protein
LQLASLQLVAQLQLQANKNKNKNISYISNIKALALVSVCYKPAAAG